MKKSDIINWINNNFPRNRLSDDAVQGLYLKKNPSSISWRLMYRNSLGKQRDMVLGRYPTITLDEARKLAREKHADIVRGIDPLQRRKEEKAKAGNTLEGYLDDIYTGILETKKSGKETRQIFNRHFSHLFNKVMSELNAKDVTLWQAKMIENGKSFATQTRAYGALKTLLNDAVKRGVLPNNPLAKVSLDRIHETEETYLQRKSKRSYLTKEQVKQLFTGLDQYQEEKRRGRRNSRTHGRSYLPCLDSLEFVDYVKPFILTMFYTGFRNGDVYGLRWEHLHFHGDAATIHKTIEKIAHKNLKPKLFP